MSKKRYLAAFGAAGVVFAGVYGAAAALDVDGGAVQAGSDDTLACDADGVTVASYRVDAEPPPVSSGVRITDIDAACAGQELFVVVLDGSDSIIGKGSATIASPQTSVNWSSGPVEVADIESIHITVD